MFVNSSGEYKKQDRAPGSDAGLRAIVGANLALRIAICLSPFFILILLPGNSR